MRPQRSRSNHDFPWSTILNFSLEQAAVLPSGFFTSSLCHAALAFNWSIVTYLVFQVYLHFVQQCAAGALIFVFPLCFVFSKSFPSLT